MCVHSCVSAVPFRGYHFYPLSISQARINSFVPSYLFLLSIQLMRPLWLTDIRGLTFYSYYFESYLEQKITVFQIECWNEIIKVASSRFASFPLSQSCNAAVDSFELFVVGKVPRRGMSECRSVFHLGRRFPFLRPSTAPDDVTTSCRARHDPSRTHRTPSNFNYYPTSPIFAKREKHAI